VKILDTNVGQRLIVNAEFLTEKETFTLRNIIFDTGFPGGCVGAHNRFPETILKSVTSVTTDDIIMKKQWNLLVSGRIRLRMDGNFYDFSIELTFPCHPLFSTKYETRIIIGLDLILKYHLTLDKSGGLLEDP
jgi:hypothetical protein